MVGGSQLPNLSANAGLLLGGGGRDGAKGRPALQHIHSQDYIPTGLSASTKLNSHVGEILSAPSKPSKYSSVADLVPFVDGRPVALAASTSNGHPDTPDTPENPLDGSHSTTPTNAPTALVRPSSIRGLPLGSSSDLRGNASGYNPGSWAPNPHSSKYHFVTFPCDPLPPSFIRSRIFGDAEALRAFDPTVWYQASPEEVARDKERALERERLRVEREERELRRRLEKGKNKVVVKGARKGAPKRRKAVREKRTRQVRPAVQAATTTRFAKVAGAGASPSPSLSSLLLKNPSFAVQRAEAGIRCLRVSEADWPPSNLPQACSHPRTRSSSRSTTPPSPSTSTASQPHTASTRARPPMSARISTSRLSRLRHRPRWRLRPHRPRARYRRSARRRGTGRPRLRRCKSRRRT